jgi:PQQ-like domain
MITLAHLKFKERHSLPYHVTALLLLAIAVPISLNAQNGWRMGGYNAQRTDSTPVIGPTTLPTFQVFVSNAPGTLRNIGADGSLYTWDVNTIRCYSPTGQPKWNVTVSARADVAIGPGTAGAVYVSTVNPVQVLAFDHNTGQPLWASAYTVTAGNQTSGLAIAADGTIYIHGGGNGAEEKLAAINPNGTKRWEVGGAVLTSGSGNGNLLLSTDESVLYVWSGGNILGFSTATGQNVSGAGGFIALAAFAPWGTLYAATLAGPIAACTANLQTCNVLSAGGNPNGFIGITVSGNLIVDYSNGPLATLNQQGTPLWTSSESFYGGFGFSDGTGNLFFVNPGTADLVALNPVTGAELWRQHFSTGFNPLLADDGCFYMTVGSDILKGCSAAPSVGTINVSTNLSTATFTISGAATYNGSGTSFMQTNALAGTYTITFGAVLGNVTPPPETKVLLAGGTISFDGNYKPALIVSPLTLTFSYKKGTAGPIEPQLLTVSSTGSSLSYNMTASSAPADVKWLATTKTSGSTPDLVGINVATGVDEGTYSGRIDVSAPNSANGSMSVPVELIVTNSNNPPVIVRSPGCTNDICVSFQSLHDNNNPNKVSGSLTITNLTGAWYEVRVDFSQTTISFGNQLPVFLLSPYGSFVTSSSTPFEFKKGETLQLVLNKDEVDAMFMFLVDVTLRAFFGVSFPTSSQDLLDFSVGTWSTFLGTIKNACAGDLASSLVAFKQHDTFEILTHTADFAGCIATNSTSRSAIAGLIKVMYNDASGILADKWLTIAGNVIERVILIVGNAPKVLQLLGSEFVASDLTTVRFTATQ